MVFCFADVTDRTQHFYLWLDFFDLLDLELLDDLDLELLELFEYFISDRHLLS